MRLPKTAYILLWFPKPSETFIFREVNDLRKMGLPVKVFTLYGKLSQGLSQEMLAYSGDVERLGIPFLKRAHADLLYWWRKDLKKMLGLMRLSLLRKPAGLEKTGENIWASLCAFRLARQFQKEGIEHIHAPWACGPATAAWIASHLTNIPFSFTARAADIFPPDSMLKDKINDSIFVRTNSRATNTYLGRLAGDNTKKIHMIYNGLTIDNHQVASVTMKPPYRLLAIGRFVRKKGYDDLIKACKILRDSGLDFRLTLVGDGFLRRKLIKLTKRCDLLDRISFPGFVCHDRVSNLLVSSDIFLMPSIVSASGDRDGIPNVIMEALMHRVPVIATAVSGIPEVIEDGVTGLLIPEKDPPAISEAVLRLVRDRISAVDMAERGRAKVRTQFDPEKNCRKNFRLYEQSLVQEETYFHFEGDPGSRINHMVEGKPLNLVILLQDLDFGGTQRYAIHLLKHLDQHLFAPELWVLRGGNDMVPIAKEAGVKIVWLSKRSWVTPVALFRLLVNLLRQRPRILYTLTVVPNIWGRIMGRIASLPVIVSGYRNQLPRQHEKWLRHLSNRIICNAEILKQEIMTGPFFYDPDRIVAIPNAVDTDFFAPAPDQRASEPTVLYVGRLVQGKDPATLLQSFKIVTRHLPNARLEMVGNGPLKKKLDAIIRAMSLDSAVSIIPGSGDIRPYLKKAWVFAMSSLREGSPNVIIEAMATGLPVVATRVGGIPELVEDGCTGKIVEPGDIKGLADALTDLLKNENQRHEMGLRARERVLDRHSPKKMAKQTEQVFLNAWNRC